MALLPVISTVKNLETCGTEGDQEIHSAESLLSVIICSCFLVPVACVRRCVRHLHQSRSVLAKADSDINHCLPSSGLEIETGTAEMRTRGHLPSGRQK